MKGSKNLPDQLRTGELRGSHQTRGVSQVNEMTHTLCKQHVLIYLIASIYTERFMGLPTKDDNLEHYKVRTFCYI